MRTPHEDAHMDTQPTGGAIVWGAAVALVWLLVGLGLVVPTWLLVAALKVVVFVGAAGFLVACLARSGEL